MSDFLNLAVLAQALLGIGLIIGSLAFYHLSLLSRIKSIYMTRRQYVVTQLEALGRGDESPDVFLATMAIIAVVVFAAALLFSLHWIMATAMALGTFEGQRLYFTYMLEKRREMFENRLPMALDQIVSCAKAGLNLAQSIAEASKFAPVPVDDELSNIVREHQLGVDIPTCLSNARARMNSHTFNLAVSALLINIKQGGDLPKAMDKISQALKEVWRLEQKIFTASQEARKGAIVMSAMPIVIVVMVMFMQPDMLDSLTSTLTGYVILSIAGILYLGGLYWMRQIINADV